MKSKSNLYAPILFGSVLLLVGFSYKLISVMERIAQDEVLSAAIIQIAVFLLPLAFYCKLSGVNYVQSLKFKYFPTNKISFCAVMFFLFFFGGLLLKYLGITFFGNAMTDTPSAIFIFSGSENGILTFVVFVIIPALFEEALFRGILLAEYEDYSSFIAVLMTSLMYAMIHNSLKNFVYYFFAGIIFGMMTVVTRSILPSLILHLMENAAYLYFGRNITDYIRQTGKSALLPFLIVSFILFFVFLMFSSLEGIYRDKAFDEFLQSRKELLRQASGEETEKNDLSLAKQLKECFLSPSFIITVVIFTVLSTNLI